MGLEVVTHLSDLVITNPVGAVDPKSQGDDHIRNIKKALRTDFPNISGVVTATHTDLSKLAGMTSSTAELNILTGVTLTAAQINDAARKGASNIFTASAQVIQHALPELLLWNTSAGAGLKQWAIQAEADGDFSIFTRSDAGGAIANALVISRDAASAVTSFAISATAITLNGINTTDLARLQANNNFTGNPQQLSGTSPELRFNETDRAADEKLWYQTASSGTFGIGTRTDAGAFGAEFFTATRSGTGITQLALNATTLSLTGTTLSFTGAVSTPNTSPSEVGYKGLPPNTQTANYTAVLADANKQILMTTTAGITATIPANASVAYPIGTQLAFTNITGGNVSIAINGGDSLALAGTGTGGTRTLANNGWAVANKVAAASWIISGAGLS